MRSRTRLVKTLIIASLLLAIWGLIPGCSGSDGEKAVKETVEDLSGKTTVDTGEGLKKQLYQLEGQELEKVQRDSAGTTGEGGSGREE